MAKATFEASISVDALQVSDAMSKDVCACTPEDPVEDAEELMQTNQIRRLPVVDDEGCLQGVLSLNDIALAAERGRKGEALSAKQVASTLSAISQHRAPHESLA